MDDVIFEEFKGTGNMELHLNRKLAERYIFPAFDIQRSSTRREDLLLDKETLEKVWIMRKMISYMMASPPSGAGMDITGALEALLERLGRTRNNEEFLATLSKDVL